MQLARCSCSLPQSTVVAFASFLFVFPTRRSLSLKVDCVPASSIAAIGNHRAGQEITRDIRQARVRNGGRRIAYKFPRPPTSCTTSLFLSLRLPRPPENTTVEQQSAANEEF